MGTVYLCSDFHLGHKNIAVHRKGVTSEEDNYEQLKENWHKTITKRDTVICLGDMCFTPERLTEFMSWRAEQKILILGNHDTDNVSFKDIANAYDKVHSLLRYKGMWLSHAPIHPDELRGKPNVHGHCHYHEVDDPRYLNICVEHTYMSPVNIEMVRQVLINRNVLRG